MDYRLDNSHTGIGSEEGEIKMGILDKIKKTREQVKENLGTMKMNREMMKEQAREIHHNNYSLACAFGNHDKCNGYLEGRLAKHLKNPTPCGCLCHSDLE